MRHATDVCVLCVALGLLLLAGCAKRETPAEEGIRTRTLLMGNAAEPASLDPHIFSSSGDYRVASALLEGLVIIDEKTSRPLPGAAQRWEISPDGLTYTFHLRPDAKWSNGDRLTSADFAYSFQRLLTPALGGAYAYMLWPLKNAEAFNTGKVTDFSAVGVSTPDEATLRLTLERPTPYLLVLIAHHTWFPVHRATVEKFGRMEARDSAWTRPGNYVGNGAFTLTEWRPNARIVVTKNPHYWDAAQNQLERIMFFPIEKSDAEERNFRAGQLHVTAALPTSKLAVYRQQFPERLRIETAIETHYLNFNVTKPPLNQPKVRRALALAVDREAIAKRIYESARPPAGTLVPPGCGDYRPPRGIATDFAAARALLAEAGFPGGKGLPVLPLDVLNNAEEPSIAEIIQATWRRELGVSVTISQLERKTLYQNEQTLKTTVATLGWIADYPDPYSFLEILRTGNGNNWTGWSSKAYDALLDEAGQTIDPSRRFELLQRAEALMLEEAPIAPVTVGARTYAIHPAVKNWENSPLLFRRYQRVRLEK